jgi:hypothetical protein
MDSIWDSLLTAQGLALLVTLIVFVVAAFLVIRSLIGFVITSVMLFIACISGFLIANNAIVHQLFNYENNASPETQKINPTSIKQTIGEVYELFRKGICTETVKVVYDPQAVDHLDDAISRLQQQQEQMRTMIKNLRTPQMKINEIVEEVED